MTTTELKADIGASAAAAWRGWRAGRLTFGVIPGSSLPRRPGAANVKAWPDG
jgi:hypothetical protein